MSSDPRRQHKRAQGRDDEEGPRGSVGTLHQVRDPQTEYIPRTAQRRGSQTTRHGLPAVGAAGPRDSADSLHQNRDPQTEHISRTAQRRGSQTTRHGLPAVEAAGPRDSADSLHQDRDLQTEYIPRTTQRRGSQATGQGLPDVEVAGPRSRHYQVAKSGHGRGFNYAQPQVEMDEGGFTGTQGFSNPTALFPRTPDGAHRQVVQASYYAVSSRHTSHQEQTRLDSNGPHATATRHMKQPKQTYSDTHTSYERPSQQRSEPSDNSKSLADREMVGERQTGVQSSLPSLQESFLAYSPAQNIEKWLDKVKTHPTFFDIMNDGKLYLKEAINALAANDKPRYESCIEKAVIFTLVGGMGHRDQRDIFKEIHRQKKSTMEEYDKLARNSRKFCEQQLAIEKPRDVAKEQQRDAEDKATNDVTRALKTLSTSPSGERHGNPAGFDRSRGGNRGVGREPVASKNTGTYAPVNRHASSKGIGEDGARQVEEESEGPESDRRDKPSAPQRRYSHAPRNAINVPDDDIDSRKTASLTGARENDRLIGFIDARYIRREPARAGKFFRVGRVFAIITHNEGGFNLNDAQTSTKWAHKLGGYTIYSHPNRFAVVRTAHGFCWAVPINTYERQGTTKQGLSRDNIEAHAVIHDSERQPETLPGERLIKLPIAVDRSPDADPLVPESRINFEKVRTVEHNVRAMAVGMISEKSLDRFERYWKEHLLKEDRKRGK